jgi:hypothetical protein
MRQYVLLEYPAGFDVSKLQGAKIDLESEEVQEGSGASAATASFLVSNFPNSQTALPIGGSTGSKLKVAGQFSRHIQVLMK